MKGQDRQLRRIVRLALEEDGAFSDRTSQAILSSRRSVTARLVAKESLVLAGLAPAAEVFRQMNRRIRFVPRAQEGDLIKKGGTIAEIRGEARAILAGERVALNFLSHLCGVATLTRRYAQRVVRFRCTIRDTRKTIPLLRALQKGAVRAGGGINHRMSLNESILIKENHIDLAGGVAAAVRALREREPRAQIQVEARNMIEVKEAIAAHVPMILLDNMSPTEMRRAVGLIREKRPGCIIEASGGITLANVGRIAAAGVDFVSVGRLTHSAPAVNISLEIG